MELYDFYDTYLYLIEHYREYVSDVGQVYYSGGSGGGNSFAIIGKFPDLFCSAIISCGTSDYAGGGGTLLNFAVPESPEALEAWKRSEAPVNTGSPDCFTAFARIDSYPYKTL